MHYCYLLFLLLGLSACGSSSEEEGEQDHELVNNFHLEGTITGAPMQKIVIEAASQNGTIKVAETVTNTNGEYTVDGNIPGLGIYSMLVGPDPANAIVLPLGPGDRVKVNATLKDFPVSPQISGPTWAKPLTQYMMLFNDFTHNVENAKLREIRDQDAQLAKYKELRAPMDAFIKKQVNTDPGNNVSLILTSLLAPAPELGLANWDGENLVLLKKIEAAYLDKHHDSPFTGMLSQQVAQIEGAYNSYMEFNSGTLAAPEIVLKNPEGTELRLSALKGKIVLVDFWASWCGPCRKENPNVVRLYKKFKSKGFEVFSVSLDQDPNAWKTAIKRDGLIWPNHVSDLMGWQTPLTQTYNFNSIPYTVLLNREGNIVGVSLRGAALEQKLEEELNKN